MAATEKRTENGRDGKGRFAKGNTGGGRPAVAKEFRERCREFMESEGWTSLISMAQNPKDRDRYRALDLLAAYAYGKPKQGLELSGADGGPVMLARVGGMTEEELQALVAGKDAKSG